MATEAQRRIADYDYDVCLSFAGEDRKYVASVAELLRVRGVNVFYDEYEESRLWGKDFYQHLDYIYTSAARFCVVFISEHYERKVWTNHEIKSAQARAFTDKGEYILPARFDDTPVPGIRSTTGFIDLRSKKPEECAALIAQKLAPYKFLEFHERENYFPPEPDILYKVMRARSKKSKGFVRRTALALFKSLQRLTPGERLLVFTVFVHSCAHDYPENVHIELDLLRRISGWPRAKIISTLSNLSSVGFEVTFCDGEGEEAEDPKMVYIRWVCRSMELQAEFGDGGAIYSTGIAIATVHAVTRHYCDDHAIEALLRLNFSSLSTATAIDDLHG